MQAAARSIPDEGLSVEERITRDMLRVVGELIIPEQDHRRDTLEVADQMNGPQTMLPQLTQFQAADTPERLEKFLARLHGYPVYMAANTELIREALASGLTAPRIVAERQIAQIKRMIETPIAEAVVPAMVHVANDADRERVRAIVPDEVYPADAAFLEALEGPYFAATRTEPGIWSAPNARETYRTESLRWTTLNLDPRDIHQSGVEELIHIEAERRSISNADGF